MKKLSVVFLSIIFLLCGCGASEQVAYENNHELLTWTVPGVVSYYLSEDSKLTEGWTMWESGRTYWVDTENLTHTYLDMRYDELGTSGETIAKAYEVQDNYTMEEMEHEYFTHHFVGESDSVYYEIYKVADADNPVSGETYWFEVCLHIDKTLHGDLQEELIADFHDLVNSIEITYYTYEQYDEEYEKAKDAE